MPRSELQRQGGRNIRRHGLRALARMGVLAVVDTGALVMGIVAARIITGGAAAIPAGTPLEIALLLLALVFTGSYGRGDRRVSLKRLCAGVVVGLLVLRGESIRNLQFTGAPWAALVWATLTFAVLVLVRIAVDLVVRLLPGKRFGHLSRAVLVGPTPADHPLLRQSFVGRWAAYDLLGIVIPDETAPRPRLRVLGGYDDLPRVLKDQDVETVFITGSLADQDFRHVVDVSLTAGCEILAHARSLRVAAVEPSVRWILGEPVVDLTRPGFKAGQLLFKRGFDIAVSASAIVLLAPLMLAIGILIKLTSRGPVFFRQQRVGSGGRTFDILKFRSMTADAEARKDALRADSIYADPRLFKITDDPRITPLGRSLRRTSLDELPQLFNVLLGDMSLVGPRPPVPSEVALYDDHHYCRFDVRPGITGPWQVGGRNRITDFEEIVRLEREYIRHWTPAEDFRILLRTLPAVLRMDGAH